MTEKKNGEKREWEAGEKERKQKKEQADSAARSGKIEVKVISCDPLS